MNAGFSAALAPALLLIVASSATAQQQPPPQPPPPSPASLPAPAALAVPNPLAPFRPGARDLYQSPDRSDRFQHLAPPAIVPGGYVPGPYYPYYPGPYYPFIGPDQFAPMPRVAQGGLALEMLPDVAQVYVDGFYVGLAQEFGLHGRPLDLAAGPHRAELRAPGYDTVSFSVMIAPNETLRYRVDMQRISAATAPRAVQPPAARKSLYVIPNCYAGDRPPTKALPSGCDLKKLQTR